MQDITWGTSGTNLLFDYHAHFFPKIAYNYPPKGRWIVAVKKYRDAKLFTDPEGDSCFSIYQISWIKMKKKNFFKIKNVT